MYTLGCFIIGGSPTPFSITIDETQSVDRLKDAIKMKKDPELNAFPADALTLYKVDIDASDDEKLIESVETISRDLTKAEKLRPLCMVSGYHWGELDPEKEKIQILVKVPESESIDPVPS
jgi:hypothetical protein